MLRKTRFTFARSAWMLPLCLLVALFLVFEGGNLLFAQGTPPPAFSDADLYRGIFLADGPVADFVPEIRDELRLSNLTEDSDVLRAVRSLHDRIIRKLEETRPGFLRAFGASMRSGDHLEIDRALEEAAVVTTEALSHMPEIAELRKEMKEDPTLRDHLLEEMKRTEGADKLPPGEIEKALDLLLAESLESKGSESLHVIEASIVALIVAVAAVVAAITVVAAQSYALVLNVAGAVNFAAALVAWKWVWAQRTQNLQEASLFREQLIDSVAKSFVGTA